MISLAEAFEAHQPYLLRVAYRLTGNQLDAEDLVGALWERMVKHWDRMDDRNLRSYFVTAMKRQAIDNYRVTHFVAISIDTVPGWAEDGNPWSDYLVNQVSLETIVESRDRLRRVVEALKALPVHERRAVVNAVEWEKRERTQAGNGNSERVALYRARKHLREAV